MSVFTGECANVPAGQWMFFDQASGEYVCLRPRLGAECAWLPKSAVGEIVELTVSTKSPNCLALSAAAEKSKKFETELTSRWRAEQPKSRAEDFARGMLGDMFGLPVSTIAATYRGFTSWIFSRRCLAGGRFSGNGDG